MDIVDFIKSNITPEMFLNLLEESGAKNLRKVGDIYRCTCPLHGGDNDTAFTFNPSNMLFNCFTECGGGDIFDFIAMKNDIDIDEDFKKVIKLTCEQFNISLDNLSLDNINLSYRKEMFEYIKYINGKNEVYNNPYDLSLLGQRYFIKDYRGLNSEFLINYGVSFVNDLNRICFEVRDENNNIIGASLRALKDDNIKWLHRPKSIKTGRILYNLFNVVNKGYKSVYIVEGIMDCLNLINLGIENVVCSFGARVTKEQTMLLIKYFDEVILAFDNDNAGIEARTKAIQRLNKLINTSVFLYETKDCGELKHEDLCNTSIVKWYQI